jgi:hypothetical protein
MKSHVCIILSIGIILTILVLLHRRNYEGFETTENTTTENTTTENTTTENTTTESISEPLKYCNSDYTTCITYSVDGTELNITTLNGSIYMGNADTSSTLSELGRLTIQFSTDDSLSSLLPFDDPDVADDRLQKWKYFDYDGITYKLVGWNEVSATDQTLYRRLPVSTAIDDELYKYQYFFKTVSGDSVNMPDEIYLSEITFRISEYNATDVSELGTESGTLSATDFTAEVRALEDTLAGSGLTVDVNGGIPCGWHYDPSTGQAGGYFADTLNSTDFQTNYSEDYGILKSYICPDYLPTCTGQRSTGIVLGKCISTEDDCNNSSIDEIMGIEKPTYSTVTVEPESDPVATTLAQKNQYNSQNLQYGIQTMSSILHENFENANNNFATNTNNTNTNTATNSTINTSTSVADTDSCSYRIENKCYDQYVNSDKLYYETGAGIFKSVFPGVGSNYMDDTYNAFTDWLAANMTAIIMWKVFSGLAAFALQYSTDMGDYRIKIFRGFIAFIFSELYLIYSVYKHIIKPHIPLAVRTINERPIYA